MPDAAADHRYRSRKFILCVSVLVIATTVLFWALSHILGVNKMMPHFIPLLTWWSGTTAAILALYKAATILDDKLNGGKA